jgi:hypothetical protein
MHLQERGVIDSDVVLDSDVVISSYLEVGVTSSACARTVSLVWHAWWLLLQKSCCHPRLRTPHVRRSVVANRKWSFAFVARWRIDCQPEACNGIWRIRRLTCYRRNDAVITFRLCYRLKNRDISYPTIWLGSTAYVRWRVLPRRLKLMLWLCHWSHCLLSSAASFELHIFVARWRIENEASLS